MGEEFGGEWIHVYVWLSSFVVHLKLPLCSLAMLLLLSHFGVSDSLWPMDGSMPGLPVPHHPLKFAQVHIHCASDAIQLSHPLTPSSPSALSLSQGLFQWVGCSHQVIKVLELKLASVLPMNIQGWFPLRLTGLISCLSTGLPGVFSSTTVWGHQCFCTLPSLQSSSHNHTWPLGRLYRPLSTE